MISIWLQEGGGMRLNDVIDVELDRPDAKPLIVVLAGSLREGIQVSIGGTARVKQRGNQTRLQTPLTPGALEEGKVIQRVLRLDNRGDATGGGKLQAVEQ